MKHVEKRGGCSPALGAEDVEPGPRQTELVCGSVCSSLRHGAPSSVRRDPTAPDRAAARNCLCDGMKPHGGGPGHATQHPSTLLAATGTRVPSLLFFTVATHLVERADSDAPVPQGAICFQSQR